MRTHRAERSPIRPGAAIREQAIFLDCARSVVCPRNPQRAAGSGIVSCRPKHVLTSSPQLRGFLVPAGCLDRRVHAAIAVGWSVVEVCAERLCRIIVLALRLALMRATDLRAGGCLRPRRLRADALRRLDFGDSSTS